MTNPATQEVIAQVPCATAAEVDRAVATAKAAFETWKETCRVCPGSGVGRLYKLSEIEKQREVVRV